MRTPPELFRLPEARTTARRGPFSSSVTDEAARMLSRVRLVKVDWTSVWRIAANNEQAFSWLAASNRSKPATLFAAPCSIRSMPSSRARWKAPRASALRLSERSSTPSPICHSGLRGASREAAL